MLLEGKGQCKEWQCIRPMFKLLPDGGGLFCLVYFSPTEALLHVPYMQHRHFSRFMELCSLVLQIIPWCFSIYFF